MRSIALVALLAGLPATAAAQPASPAPAPTPAPSPAPAPAPAPAPGRAIGRPDPARIAAAERLIAITMPDGFVRETMSELMPNADTILAAFAERLGIDTADMTREQRIRAVEERGGMQDRHFRERLDIALSVTTRVTGELLLELEPQMRRVMVTLVARQFSVEEIGEMTSFFATPAGQRWVRMSMTIGRDPAYQEILVLMAPRMLEAQERIDAAVRDATAHLDPVPQS